MLRLAFLMLLMLVSPGQAAPIESFDAFLAHFESKALAAGNVVPSNTKAKATTPEAEKKLSAFHGFMKTAVNLDWDAINEKRPEWNSRWNKMIER